MHTNFKTNRFLAATFSVLASLAINMPARAQKAGAVPIPRTATPPSPQIIPGRGGIPKALAVAVQQAKLTASDQATQDFFGTSVALSGDTAVVGALGDDSPAADAGSAYVFVRTGTTWTQQAKLTASDQAANDRFGVSVAISGDTIVVGAGSDDSPNTDAGSAYVFVRTGSTWAEQQKLVASDQAPFDDFGQSVAINGDTIIVGADLSNSPLSNTGAAYVFARTGSTWTQQQKLTASDAATDYRFGISLAISGDTAVVGADGAGAAYVFVNGGSGWAQQQKVAPTDGISVGGFGEAVAINGDTLVVGARFSVDDGAAYVFVRSGTNWTQQQRLPNPEPANPDDPDFYGDSVAVSGNTIVVGASSDIEDAPFEPEDSGSAYVFVRTGTTWTLHQKLVGGPGESAGEGFGFSAAISGSTILIGAYSDDRIAINAGSAYVYTNVEVSPTLPGQLIVSEFRARGPNGDGDEFIELYNNTDAAIVVDPADGSSGFALVASNGQTRFVIPTGTVIRARGHLLATNVAGYGLGAYATGDLEYFQSLSVNVGFALFNTSAPANFAVANRLDAVGSTAETNALFREGAGYDPVNVVDMQYSFVRDLSSGWPQDTQDNQADFRVVSPTVIVRADATYGYPGPENLASPIERSASFSPTLLDPTQPSSDAPNRVRTFSATTPCSTFGTLAIRRTLTNNTGGAVMRLRFRVVAITTAPAPAGTADLRPISSSDVVVTVNGSSRVVRGTTLETAGGVLPNSCGGLNSSLSLGTTLAAGASVDIQFLLGIQQTGTFRFLVIVEALP